MFNDLILLLFPKHCNACYSCLLRYEKEICTNCRNELPVINTTTLPFDLSVIFDDDIHKNNFSSLFYFEKNSEVQELLHNLKYRKHAYLGKTIGHWHASVLLRNNNFTTVDIVIPMPIHKKRLRNRGYNQVALYAKTIATNLTAEYRDDILVKRNHKKSQVYLNRKERFENILNSLILNNSAAIKGKHVLILDDIITTGATMRACVSILKDKTTTISVASIALVKTQCL